MIANFESKVYLLENLGCANCAAKMEKAINDLPDVSCPTITYATKQTAADSEESRTIAATGPGNLQYDRSRCKVVERIGKPVLAENINQRKKRWNTFNVR